jgi:hypothetical protein
VSRVRYIRSESSKIQVTIAGGLGETDAVGLRSIWFRRLWKQVQRDRISEPAGKWSQGDNINDQLKSFGLTNPPI